MKLEVGMYVRTDEGICKIDKIETETFSTPAYHLDINDEGLYYGDVWFEDTKVSNNIIDLIEAGDYVNGIKVTSIHTTVEGNVLIGLGDMFGFSKFDNDYQIKSIVTKEMFESMQYKVD